MATIRNNALSLDAQISNGYLDIHLRLNSSMKAKINQMPNMFGAGEIVGILSIKCHNILTNESIYLE